jgi:hypothetical protein
MKAGLTLDNNDSVDKLSRATPARALQLPILANNRERHCPYAALFDPTQPFCWTIPYLCAFVDPRLINTDGVVYRVLRCIGVFAVCPEYIVGGSVHVPTTPLPRLFTLWCSP